MSDRSRLLRGLGILAAAALAFAFLPRGGEALDIAGASIQAIFLALIAAAGWRLYYTRRMWVIGLSDRERGLLYGAIGLAVFTIVARGRFSEQGDAGSIMWFAVLAACGFAVYKVWRDSQQYVV